MRTREQPFPEARICLAASGTHQFLASYCLGAFDLQLLRLHLTVTRNAVTRIGGKLLNPFTQHVRMHIQIELRLGNRHPRPRTTFTASNLKSRLNFLLCIEELR